MPEAHGRDGRAGMVAGQMAGQAPARARGGLAQWRRTALALGVVVVWGVCFVLIKVGLGDTPPVFAAALRALVAGGPLLLVAAALDRLRPGPGAWTWLVLLGLTNTTVGLAGMYLSVGQGGAAIPSVLANAQALLVVPAGFYLFGEPVTRSTVGGLLVGLVGVLLTTASGSGPLGSWAGSLLALGASAGLAAGSVIVKQIGGRVDFLTATTSQYVLGGVPLLAWALLKEDVRRTTWSPAFVTALLFLGLAGSAGTSLLWFRLVQEGELIRLSAYTLLTPVVGLILAVVLLGESLRPLEALGVGLTLAGVAWVERRNGDRGRSRSERPVASCGARGTRAREAGR